MEQDEMIEQLKGGELASNNPYSFSKKPNYS